MFKKSYVIFALSLLLISCGNTPTNNDRDNTSNDSSDKVIFNNVIDINLDNYKTYIEVEVGKYKSTSTGMVPVQINGAVSLGIYENAVIKYASYYTGTSNTTQYVYTFYLNAAGNGKFDIFKDHIQSGTNDYHIEVKTLPYNNELESGVIYASGKILLK